MFTNSPFADLPAFIPPIAIQAYVVIMILMVAGGTLFDIFHKNSAKYFFRNWQNSKAKATRTVGGAQAVSLTIQTIVEGLASGEFCNMKRRISHLLTMYGFLAYIATTIIMVFSYPTPATPPPAILPLLWYIGALMILAGGYWFWFFIRVDVVAEGHSPFRLVRADLFIVSLLVSVTLGLVWACMQAIGNTPWTTVFMALYILSTTVLFGSVPWSKFSHMFFKPAAALQKRIEQAEGSSNLPDPADSPEVFASPRRVPRNY